MSFPPIAQGLTSPHPYPCENHAPSQFSCREHRWSVYLIKVAYLHDDKLNICHMPRYIIGENSVHRNITQLNRWQGFCL